MPDSGSLHKVKMRIKSPGGKKAEETFISNQFHPLWSHHERPKVELCVYVSQHMNVGASTATGLAQRLSGGPSGDRIC